MSSGGHLLFSVSSLHFLQRLPHFCRKVKLPLKPKLLIMTCNSMLGIQHGSYRDQPRSYQIQPVLSKAALPSPFTTSRTEHSHLSSPVLWSYLRCCPYRHRARHFDSPYEFLEFPRGWRSLPAFSAFTSRYVQSPLRR